MKTLLFILAFAAPFFTGAQKTDSTLVEQYCEMTAEVRGVFANKVVIDVNYGEERKFFKTYGIKDERGNLVKFNSAIDGLNFLGQQGWKLVQVYPVTNSSTNIVKYYYILKREFSKAAAEKAVSAN